MSETPAYWIVSVPARTREEAEEVSGWLETACDATPVEVQLADREVIWLEAYFEEEIPARLLCGAALGRFPGLEVTVRHCAARDWTTFWRHHFRPVEIGRRLFILPEWLRDGVETPAGRERILINPGLSFGTGNHFTTRFCLEMIDELHARGVRPERMFDVGCGSAILSVAARKLGWGPVLAVDLDELALGQAAENLDLNGISDGVELKPMDVTRDPIPDGFPLVVANIYGALLMELASRLVRATTEWLILSGIRAVEAEAVSEVFAQAGMEEVIARGDPEWFGLLLRRC